MGTLGFRDLHRPSVTGLTGCLHLVVMIYFWDVEPEGGATAIVPGSHRYEDAARDHGFTHSRLGQDGIVVGAVPAGGAMLFDNRTYHTALPSTNGVDRRSLTIRYIPSWCRPLGAIANNAAALVQRDHQILQAISVAAFSHRWRRLQDAAGKLDTPLRRQLLGLEAAGSEESRFDPEGQRENWFDPAFCARTPRPDLR